MEGFEVVATDRFKGRIFGMPGIGRVFTVNYLFEFPVTDAVRLVIAAGDRRFCRHHELLKFCLFKYRALQDFGHYFHGQVCVRAEHGKLEATGNYIH
ncbi:MAG: hypothetical protein ACD_39C00449G0001 [uncultured bacterium]|nr:MAG: hypothetical protein ACD_39C00449G0001 [uncultured bacterium]